MITKTYELVGKDNCMLRTIYCGTRVSMEFKGGNFINGKNALLRTSNPFVQDAIDYFAKMGYKVENDDMLEELKDKLSVSFPNMK